MAEVNLTLSIEKTLQDALVGAGCGNQGDYEALIKKATWQYIARNQSLKNKINSNDDEDVILNIKKEMKIDAQNPQILDFGIFMENCSSKVYGFYRSSDGQFMVCGNKKVTLDFGKYVFKGSEEDQRYAWMFGYHDKVKVYSGLYDDEFFKIILPL